MYLVCGESGLVSIPIIDGKRQTLFSAYTWDAAVSDNKAYVGTNDGLVVLDISKPEQPVRVGTALQGRSVMSVAAYGRDVYAVAGSTLYYIAGQYFSAIPIGKAWQVTANDNGVVATGDGTVMIPEPSGVRTQYQSRETALYAFRLRFGIVAATPWDIKILADGEVRWSKTMRITAATAVGNNIYVADPDKVVALSVTSDGQVSQRWEIGVPETDALGAGLNYVVCHTHSGSILVLDHFGHLGRLLDVGWLRVYKILLL